MDDGSSYEGEVVNGVPHGYGAIIYLNGDEYVGEFESGSISGRGTMSYANGEKYVGEWKDNKISGRGTFNYANGEKYVGQFRNGKANGRGTFTYADGTTEVGEWQDGQKLEDVTSADIDKELDLEFWKEVKGSDKMSDYEDYLREFPNGKFTSIAKARIEKLKDRVSIEELAKLDQFSGIYKISTAASFCWTCDVGLGVGNTKLKLEISGDSIEGMWDIHYDHFSNKRWVFVIEGAKSTGERTATASFRRLGPRSPYWPDYLDVYIEFLEHETIEQYNGGIARIKIEIKSKKNVGSAQLKEYVLLGKKVK